MYSVGNDPRCLKTCSRIRDTLYELIKENDFNLAKVDVSDISMRSGVSRTTFYRHFDSPSDVLAWNSSVEVESACDYSLIGKRDYLSFCEYFFGYMTSNTELLELLVEMDEPDIFLEPLERSLLSESDLLFHRSRLTEVQVSYIVTIWSVIVWAIIRRWIENGKAESAEELVDIAIRNLPIAR